MNRKAASRRARSRFKAQERRIAKWLGTTRTPLSGGNSKHTRSDTLHPRFFVEAKGAKGASGTNGWAWKLSKLDTSRVYLVAFEPNLYLVHTSQLDGWESAPLDGAPECARFVEHWKGVADIAADENKLAVCVFCLYQKRGWWIMTSHDIYKALEIEVRNAASE